MNWSDMSHAEKDALVAEQVMGWTVMRFDSWTDEAWVAICEAMDNLVCDDDGTEPCVAYIVGDGDLKVGTAVYQMEDGETWAWSPTTDISAAWEVVEKVRASGVLFEIGSRVSGDWYAMTMPPDFLSCPECDAPYDWPYSHAPTAPEAICLAALRAVGAVDG